jgi:hypothetical protein
MENPAYGIFHAYGLFWRLDEINWTPGKGKRREFRLLGRRGKNVPGLLVADFRKQQGIYILYGNLGPHYVGLTRKQTLGKRLKDHLTDKHKSQWDRFSWFTFTKVLKSQDEAGLQNFSTMAVVKALHPEKGIGDIEALLIKAMALKNVAQMKFAQAKEWHQIKQTEAEHYLSKVAK